MAEGLRKLGPPPRMPRIDPINPPAPNTTYRSAINTAAPIDRSMAQSFTRMPSPYQNKYGVSAGDKSRSAFAQALMSNSQNTMAQQIDRFNVAQRTQAEKSRGEDILSQRQSVHDRYRMDEMRNIFEKDTNQRYIEGMRDLKHQYKREAANAAASAMAGMFGGIGGALFGLI